MIFLLSIPIALADDISGALGSLNALGSGYGIGRWPYNDGNVPINTEVAVRVATLNENITHVILVWKVDDSTVHTTGKIPITLSGDTWGTAPIYDNYDPVEGYSSYILNVAGDWGVQAYYYNDTNAPFDEYKLTSGKIAIKAISFLINVIPEIPYGTIGILLTMLGAFFVFYIRSK